jgi:aminoglycoside 3-N-acetyltransferase
MGFPGITRQQVIDCLLEVGTQAGDGLLVHSAIQYLGRPTASPDFPAGGVGLYLDAILTVIGPEGTVCVPTFNFDFAQGAPYDPENTPSKGMGAFSEYVRQQPGARRTSHPMQSFSVLGHWAEDLASRDTPSAFDPGSASERMLDLNFKLLLLGADISASSIYHISEQRNQVPYRYWKDFFGQVHTPFGWEQRTYRMYARDLVLDPHTTAIPVQRLLEARGQWRTTPLNLGWVAACRLVDFVAAVDHFLQADPWSLVTNPPSSARQ